MMSSDDLTTKRCACGEKKTQVIGYDESEEGELVPIRRGWYCVACRHWERAILRERKTRQ